jgi:RimJ/RimL family protein N-acetyltransferase
MMEWGRKSLGIAQYKVTSSDDNIRAIALYKRLGFREIARDPLVRSVTEGGERFDVAPVGYTGPIGRYRVVLSL